AVDGDADVLHLNEDIYQWQLDVGKQSLSTDLVELAAESGGKLEHGPVHDHRVLGGHIRGGVVLGVEGEHPLSTGIGLLARELAAEMPHGEVAEVVGTLVGPDQVGRQSRVALQPAQPPAPRRESMDGNLRV